MRCDIGETLLSMLIRVALKYEKFYSEFMEQLK